MQQIVCMAIKINALGEHIAVNVSRGGDIGGTGGRSPQKNLRWGTAHASVPPIFGEVVLSDARESMNRVKMVFIL